MAKQLCSVEGCGRDSRANGMCKLHYERVRKGIPPTGRPKIIKRCSVEGCERPFSSKGFCAVHYARWARHGSTEERTPPSRERECKSCARILRIHAHELCGPCYKLAIAGIGKIAEYALKNKEAISQRKKEHYQKNKERIKKRVRDRRKNNLEKVKGEERRKHHKYKHITKEKRKDYFAEYHPRYKRSERGLETARRSNQKRRAWRIGNGGEYTKEELDLLREAHAGVCPACGRKEPFPGKRPKLTIDHITPLSKGGTNNIENIQLMCLSCNVMKNNKLE